MKGNTVKNDHNNVCGDTPTIQPIMPIKRINTNWLLFFLSRKNINNEVNVDQKLIVAMIEIC